MAIYYIENENGSYLSSDGSKCFMKLSGRQAYEYLKSTEGQMKRFIRTSSHEDGREEEFVEVPSTFIQQHRKQERHEQYVSDCMENSGLVTISLYAMEADESSEVASGEELIADPVSAVEEQVLYEMELETLHRAIQTLSAAEQQLIRDLYLSDPPLTVREVGEKYGVHYVTISKRRKDVLKKLRDFFEK